MLNKKRWNNQQNNKKNYDAGYEICSTLKLKVIFYLIVWVGNSITNHWIYMNLKHNSLIKWQCTGAINAHIQHLCNYDSLHYHWYAKI